MYTGCRRLRELIRKGGLGSLIHNHLLKFSYHPLHVCHLMSDNVWQNATLSDHHCTKQASVLHCSYFTNWIICLPRFSAPSHSLDSLGNEAGLQYLIRVTVSYGLWLEEGKCTKQRENSEEIPCRGGGGHVDSLSLYRWALSPTQELWDSSFTKGTAASIIIALGKR